MAVKFKKGVGSIQESGDRRAGAPALRLVAGLDPVFVESDVLDGFAVGCEVAVGDVDGAVLRLDHGRVVILAVDLRGGAAIEMALPFPGGAFVVGERGYQ